MAGDIIFAVCAGVAFILLGRWMYANPSKVYSSAVSTNPNSNTLPRFIRTFATLVIFIGGYAVIGGGTSPFLPGWLVIALGTAAGVAAAIILRPKVATVV